MRSRLFALLIAAAACGGSPKSTTPPPTLPDDPKVASEPATKPANENPPPPEEPKLPEGPLDIPLAMPKTEVKLVSAGKGKKEKLVVHPKAGAKQSAAWTLDLTVGQEAPAQLGGKQEQIAPTATIVGETEIKEVDATSGQAKYQMTVASVDAAQKTGSSVKPEDFKGELQSLVGATFSGTVEPNGATSDVALHIEKPDMKAVGTVQFLQLAALPMWPVLPKEAVGAGAKWTVTSTQLLAGKVEITKTVTYELVGKKGNAWTIKGTTQVSGKDQEVQPGAKLAGIAGDGAHEISMTDGAVLPTFKQAMTTTFTISITPPAEEGGAPPTPVGVKFWFNFGNSVEPK